MPLPTFLVCHKHDEIIESKSTNDFQRCKCGAVGIDGGLYYAKRVYGSNLAELHH
jgi:hypothetical protein